jgi:hypothetical protein
MISLQEVVSKVGVDNLTTMIMESLEQHGGLSLDAIAQ